MPIARESTASVRRPGRLGAGVAPLLLIVGAIPLIPRPTYGTIALGITAFAAVVLGVAFVASYANATVSKSTERVLIAVVLVTITITAIEALKILLRDEWAEIPYLAARFLSLAVSLIVFLWVRSSGLSIYRVVLAFIRGYLLLAVLIVLIGITGITVFEPPGPTRWYTVGVDFYKSAGIPRSFGELSILAAIAWAGLLVFKRRFRQRTWILSAVLVLGSILAAQSRTGIITALVVTGAWALLRIRPAALVGRSLVVMAVLVPFFADLLLARTRGSDITSFIVGEETFETNTEVRLELNNLAFRLLLDSNPVDAIFGVGRSVWDMASQSAVGESTVVHNHVLAALLFGGLVAGSLFLLLCYLVPLWRLTERYADDTESLFLFVAGLGMMVSLQFYSGYFSLTVALLVGLMWTSAFASPGSSSPTVATRTRP